MIKYTFHKLESDDIKVIIIRDYRGELVGFNFHYGSDDNESTEDYKIPSKELWSLYQMLLEREVIQSRYARESILDTVKFWNSKKAELPRMLKAIAIYIRDIMCHGDEMPPPCHELDYGR